MFLDSLQRQLARVLQKSSVLLGKCLPGLQRHHPFHLKKQAPGTLRQHFLARFKKFTSPSPTSSKVLLGVGIFCLIFGSILFAGIETGLYVQSVKNLNFSQAQQHAQNARPVVRVLSLLTFAKVPDIEAWKYALLLGNQLDELQAVSTNLTQSFAQEGEATSIADVIPVFHSLEKSVTELAAHIDNSFVIKRVMTAEQHATITSIATALRNIQPLADSMLVGKQSWVVIFQNSDELRATGGFAGSYAIVTLEDGVLSQIVVEDIYDADGQFAGYLQAPAGIREYTSSSRGLRLPDANWYPHFPQSAQTMLQFFAFGNKRQIDGVITINLPVAEAILRTTGPIALPDYTTSLTANNLHQALRDERAEFFPGSIQKKHILSQAMAGLRQKLMQLPPDQQLTIFKQLIEFSQQKEIQAYAIDPDLQALFQKYGITGEVGVPNPQESSTDSDSLATSETQTATPTAEPTIFYLVESNVGINKANRHITRAVTLSQTLHENLRVKIEFQNSALKNTATLLTPVVGVAGSPTQQVAKGGYANYQRLLISPHFQLTSVRIDGVPVEKIDRETLTYDDVVVDQYGFLVIVLPEKLVTVQLELQPSDPSVDLVSQPLLIQKQSGLLGTPYSLYLPGLQETFVLEKDRLITVTP